MLKMLGRTASSVAVLALVFPCSTAVVDAQTKPASPSVQQGSSGHVPTGAKAMLKGKKQKAKKEVVQVPPPPPPPPPTPEQMPAQTPEVSYVGGLLTINAPNSTMNDVLAAVRRVTGATIEKPPMGGADRVVAHLGPGQPKDILAALFNGSRYDYIIVGPMGQPGAVQRVILSAKSNIAAQSPIASSMGRPAPNAQPQHPRAREQPDNSADTEDMTVPEQNAPEQEEPQEQPQEQPQQVAPQPGYPQPVSPEQQPQGQPPQGQQDQGQQPHVKSPEELLRELQQMQQQQQNQQNQQNQQQPPQ